MRSHNLRASLASASGGGGYTSGTFYPMFGVKLIAMTTAEKSDISSSPANSSKCEQPMQRALSFDTANTTELDGTETTSAILTIMDTSLYTCNSDFGTGGETISAIKLIHYDSNKALKNQAEFAFNGTSFNIYDHACNALPNLGPNNTNNNSFDHPSQMGTITSASLDGTSITPASGKTFKNHVFVNVSSYSGSLGTSTHSSWTVDDGDYCFLGVTDKDNHTAGTDQLDTALATTKGLAFGISDSDGRATVSGTQYPPRTLTYGINRRSYGYHSLCTNWVQRDQTNHSGGTTSGYFLVYGKVN